MPAAPSWSSAERTRAGSFSPGRDDHLGAGDLERVGLQPRGGAADDDRERQLGRAAHELGVERQPALGVEHDAARLARPRRRCARSSCGSSASAVPIPTTTASRSARQWCESSRDSSPEIHFESPVRVATLPSSVIADLKSTCGRPVRACLRNAWLSSRARIGRLAVGDDDLDALVAQDPEPAAGRLLGRVVGGRRRRARCPPRGSRRCTAASARGGSTARATRTSSPRAGRRCTRRAPRARRAPRRRRRGSPRRAPSRRAPRRRRRAGSG